MNIQLLLDKITHQPSQVGFDEVIETITQHYLYTPCRFSNGDQHNAIINDAGSNQGSCKIFAFAKLNNLTEQQTLHCFGDYYRQEVLENPEGDDHANIRHFMRHGWSGIQFDQMPLTEKQ
ncbi:MAG: HopJ type III effector protein [Gammaproteobacteria bacterium]|nr:HopJ type III effector protein [Gammaproteobacteria bacterium]MCF6231064.1 HopJ type III effector protein [Gammaproteobacteria bacterium]